MKATKTTSITLTLTEEDARRLALILGWTCSKMTGRGSVWALADEARMALRKALLGGSDA